MNPASSTHRSAGGLELEKRTDEQGVPQPFLSGAGYVKHFMEIWYVSVTPTLPFLFPMLMSADLGEEKTDEQSP